MKACPPLYGDRSRRIMSGRPVPGLAREGPHAPPTAPELGFVQPDLVELQLEGLMHEQSLHIVRVVAVERAPERLYQDARILKDRLDVLHQLLALSGVGDRKGGTELLVEVGVRIRALVPGFARA